MKPTILEGDRVYVNKLAYGLRVPFTTIPLVTWSSPERGEIVVFESQRADLRLIKRVIGLEGDTVALVGNVLYINGEKAKYVDSQVRAEDISWHDERAVPMLQHESIAGIEQNVALLRPDSYFGPVTVPQGHLFVMGDNRDFSGDSRYYGFVPMKELLGRANGVLVSLDPQNNYKPRTDRFIKSF